MPPGESWRHWRRLANYVELKDDDDVDDERGGWTVTPINTDDGGWSSRVD